MLAGPFQSLVRHVGQSVGDVAPDAEDEDSISLVRRAKEACRYEACPDFVACAFQTSRDSIEGEIDRSTHVFSKYVTGSNLSDDAEHLEPEAASLAFETCFASGDGQVLAGTSREASENNINWIPVGFIARITCPSR